MIKIIVFVLILIVATSILLGGLSRLHAFIATDHLRDETLADTKFDKTIEKIKIRVQQTRDEIYQAHR